MNQTITLLREHHDIVDSDTTLTPKLKNKAKKLLSLLYTIGPNPKGYAVKKLKSALLMRNDAETISLINRLISIKLLNRGKCYNCSAGRAKELFLNMVKSETEFDTVYYSDETVEYEYTYRAPNSNKTVASTQHTANIEPARALMLSEYSDAELFESIHDRYPEFNADHLLGNIRDAQYAGYSNAEYIEHLKKSYAGKYKILMPVRRRRDIFAFDI